MNKLLNLTQAADYIQDQLLNSQQAADYLHIAIGRFHSLVNEGKINGIDDAKKYKYYTVVELDRFLRSTSGAQSIKPKCKLTINTSFKDFPETAFLLWKDEIKDFAKDVSNNAYDYIVVDKDGNEQHYTAQEAFNIFSKGGRKCKTKKGAEYFIYEKC